MTKIVTPQQAHDNAVAVFIGEAARLGVEPKAEPLARADGSRTEAELHSQLREWREQRMAAMRAVESAEIAIGAARITIAHAEKSVKNAETRIKLIQSELDAIEDDRFEKAYAEEQRAKLLGDIA